MKSTSVLNIFILLSSILIFLMWPFNFLLKNGFSEFTLFFLPTLFLGLSFFFFKKEKSYWLVFILSLALINPSFIFIPIFSAIFYLVFTIKAVKLNEKIPRLQPWSFIRKEKLVICLLIVAALISVFSFKTFKENSIFEFDYQAGQKLIREGYIYPSIWLSRLFQNKPGIYLEKFEFNFFAIVDPNNYFFNFHPGELIANNQNLVKFPSLSIFMFLVGLYKLVESRFKKYFLIILPAIIINLSFLNNFDKYDLAIYLPLALIILSGFNFLLTKINRFKIILLIIFILFTLVEYLHLVIEHFF